MFSVFVPVSAIKRQGEWEPFWHETLYSTSETMDGNTRSTEGVHASQQKLLMGTASGATSFSTFSAKSTNRYAGTQVEVAVHRNWWLSLEINGEARRQDGACSGLKWLGDLAFKSAIPSAVGFIR